MKSTYLKIPVELAQFSLTEGKVREAGTYLSGLFLYPGKVRTDDTPAQGIAEVIDISERSVYRHFKWLLSRNWIGKDTENNWLFFRGLDRVHSIEGWQFARAAIMQKRDLQTLRAFMAGVVLSSLVKTGKGQQTERLTGRSEPTAAPVSLSVLADALEVSTSTAYRLRKLADEHNYIKNKPNLVQVTNWTPDDLKHLKASDVGKVPVELLGYADKRIAAIDRIRYKKNKLYLQEPNLITPLLHLKSRKGLSNYSSRYPVDNVSQVCQ